MAYGPGAIINDRYRILDKLGAGAHGIVYRAGDLGVLIFRALSGRTPAPSSNVLDICAWATSGERPSLHALRPTLPTAIDAWVHKALAIAPGDRFQSVASLWTALEGLLGTRAASPF